MLFINTTIDTMRSVLGTWENSKFVRNLTKMKQFIVVKRRAVNLQQCGSSELFQIIRRFSGNPAHYCPREIRTKI